MEKELNEWEMVIRHASTLEDVEDILRIKEEMLLAELVENGINHPKLRGACNSAMLLEPITWKGKPQPTGPYPSSGGSDRRTEPQPAGLPYADLL